MKIGFDARMILSARRGLGRSAYLLLKYLLKIDKVNSYYIFLDREDDNQEIPFAENAKKIILPGRNYVIWEQLLLPWHLRRLQLDIIHFPVGTAPVAAHKKSIITIHDLTRLLPSQQLPSYSPRLYERLSRLYIKWITPRIAQKAEKIIVDSGYTGKDVERFLGIAPDKIEVVHLAPDPEFRIILDREEIKATLNKLNISGEYIFSLGSRLGFKNTRGLIAAFHRLISMRGDCNLSLVIAGIGEDEYFKQMIERLGVQDKVQLLEFIPDRDLINLYNGALFFVYPSFYEGFGLPPLEAMACGTPVVCSNRTSLPEIVGDAAYLVNPDDPLEITKAMEKLMSSQELREELRQKGLHKVKEYSWETTAQQVLEVYQMVNAI